MIKIIQKRADLGFVKEGARSDKQHQQKIGGKKRSNTPISFGVVHTIFDKIEPKSFHRSKL